MIFRLSTKIGKKMTAGFRIHKSVCLFSTIGHCFDHGFRRRMQYVAHITTSSLVVVRWRYTRFR